MQYKIVYKYFHANFFSWNPMIFNNDEKYIPSAYALSNVYEGKYYSLNTVKL